MNLQEKYRKILNKNNRILNVSHLDLDGVGCSIVLQNIYKNIEFRSLKYGEVNKCLESINFDFYDCVILTDISPEDESVFKLSDKIFLLDHHPSALKYNDPNSNRLVREGTCAATFVKEFFENLFKIDLSYLNDLLNIINDYDLWILNDSRSWAFNELYFKMYESDFIRRFKNGDTKLRPDELKYIDERRKLFNEEYKKLDIYEFDSINACFFIGTNFINDFCHKLMDENGYDVTICVNPKSRNCSVRTKRDDLDVGKVLQELGIGGGHKKAGAFRLNMNEEVSTKLDMIEKYLYYNCEDIKKCST